MEDSKGNSNSTNMEALISKVSFDLVEEDILDENDINKLLGVLANDGVYAMWVYASSTSKLKNDNNKLNKFYEQIVRIGSHIRGNHNSSQNDRNKNEYFIDFSKDLNNLLLLKQLLERTLIYARYYAKTLEDKGNEKNEQRGK